VAHLLARHVKNVTKDMIWMEDTPHPVAEALYFDFMHLFE